MMIMNGSVSDALVIHLFTCVIKLEIHPGFSLQQKRVVKLLYIVKLVYPLIFSERMTARASVHLMIGGVIDSSILGLLSIHLVAPSPPPRNLP